MKAAVAAICVMSLAPGCASVAPPAPAASQSRILQYERSNFDGTEVETVSVFRPDATHLEVVKTRQRCTSAAFVTAELDPGSGQVLRMTGGRLRPDGGQQAQGLLTYDPTSRLLHAALELPGGTQRAEVKIENEPWHLYDFDLASLSVKPIASGRPRRNFSIGLALVLVGTPGQPFLSYLGRADAAFVRKEPYAGLPALRYQVGGEAFGSRGGGPLWLDPVDGHVVGAEWGVPNHSEYRNFKLTLRKIDDGGTQAWKELRLAHHRGCGAAD